MAESESWARKYRPKTVDEYLGASVKGLIESRFSDQNRLPQVVLFQGPRGTGKTTMARLLAKQYLCLEPVNGRACGHCEMCLDLDEKLIQTETGVDPIGVREVDIAAEGQKKDIDDIISESLEVPVWPLKYKVLILDEFHMASAAAQNRLLKICEEPPKHLVLFLCTTNPEKILGTILSRCQVKINVHKADVEELANRLLYICQQEKIETSLAALKVIARQADRVPREAIMLLEQIALSNNYKVTLEAIQKATGHVANETYMAYYEAAGKSLEDILIFVSGLKKSDTSFEDFIKGLTRFTMDSIKIRYGIGVEDFSPEYVKAAKKLFGMYNTEEMDCLLQIIEYANKMMAGNNTEAKEELIITTTAMRIGRVGLLNHGLSYETSAGDRENRGSSQKYAEEHQKELLGQNKSVRTGSETAMIASIFGKDTLMVTQKPQVECDDSEADGSDDGGHVPTEEEDEAFFKRFFSGGEED